MTEPTIHSLDTLRRELAANRLDAGEVVARSRTLARSLGADLNAFTEVIDDPARGDGPLAGVPVAVKDVFVDGGRAPTMGSRVHAKGMSGTAEVLIRLRAAGASIVGYTNMHEWGIGTTSAITASGPVLNPWDRDRIAGGSSGGSAAAVAAGIVPVAVGTDAGGSIRVPAACCGVVGVKPTFGAISMVGEAAGASELNAAGVIARSVDDAALLFSVLGDRPVASTDVTNVRVGVPSTFFFDNIDARMEAVITNAISSIGPMSVVPVSTEGVERAAEVVSRSLLPFVATLVGDALDERADELDPSTLKALRLGVRYRDEPPFDPGPVLGAWDRAFGECDVVVTPTLPAPAPLIGHRKIPLPLGERSADLEQIALNAPMNVAGVPAVAIPCGEVDGMPVSLTLSARRGDDDLLISVARVVEHALGMAYSGRVAPRVDS